MTHAINIHINYVLDSCFALVMTGPISAQHTIPIGSFFTYNTISPGSWTPVTFIYITYSTHRLTFTIFEPVKNVSMQSDI